MKLVYICSPYIGSGTNKTDRLQNIVDAQHFCDIAIKKYGVIPIAPHAYFTQFLCDDIPEQRELGLRMAKEMLSLCHEVWIFASDGVSDGMKAEIQLAKNIGIPGIFKNWVCESI